LIDKFYISGELPITFIYSVYLGPLEMEPQMRAGYSKPLEPDEIEEVLMDEESGGIGRDRRTYGLSCAVLMLRRRR
jgi:hypothetical protein